MAYADDGFVQYTYWSATFVKSSVPPDPGGENGAIRYSVSDPR